MKEADAIFDAVINASTYIHLHDKRAEKIKQLYNVQNKRCGNCFHFMKSSCLPETKHYKFKNINSLGCSDFVLDDSNGLIEKFTAELKEIDNEINIKFPNT